MNVMEAIFTRRSVGIVKPDPVEPEKIRRLLEAAVYAPNHHRTEPWKFFVLTGEGRRPLGRTLAAIMKEKMEDPSSEENEKKLRRAEEKAFRAPVVIAVAAIPRLDNDKVLKIEEIGAVDAAIQNMLLAAHAEGLGAIWRTGAAAYHPKMKALFGLEEKDEIVGFIYIGYPDMTPREPKKAPLEDKVRWIDHDRSYVDGSDE